MLYSSSGSTPKSNVDYDTPEERAAARFAERRGLVPPFDVETVAKSLADVAEKNFPIDIDGLCLDVKGRKGKPQIWVRRGLNFQRRNFTLAHEIGHIVIPWHTGTIVDELDIDDSDETTRYHQMEGEANRFAAELLMPKAWARSIIERADHLQGAMKAIMDVAQVSGHAASIRAVQLGPPGYVVNAVRDGIVERSYKTNGTNARLPSRGDPIENVQMFTFENPIKLVVGRVAYFWWKERERVEIPKEPNERWRKILEEIVLDFPPNIQHKIKQRINAIVATAFRFHPIGSPIEEMYWSLLKVLENRSDSDPWLSKALSSRRFQDYAMARLYERHKQR